MVFLGTPSKDIEATITKNIPPAGAPTSAFALPTLQREDGEAKQLASGKLTLVGGWTNPCEKYARQNGESFPQIGGEHKKIFETTTDHLEHG